MATTGTTKIFGIRHHGAGSAKALLKALAAFQPDSILIEAPQDTEHLIPQATLKGMTPPLAMLVHNPKNLEQAAYFPFAYFSPEWQALQFADTQKIPVGFMDLPMQLQFTLNEKNTTQITLDLDDDTITMQPRDPLGDLARLAGYSDTETWWGLMFENRDNPIEVFDYIAELMSGLREKSQETAETLLREAYMRRTIRKNLKEGKQRIAVVCGAWHVPALIDLDKKYTEKNDTSLLKGLKKASTEATWVVWSYEQLAQSSGYQAGIVSPAWYELLFDYPQTATLRWVLKAARLMRKRDIVASSAHVIDTVRLAEALATLRERPLPSLEELHEAAQTTLCEGNAEKMTLIEKELIIGKAIGKIPPEVPRIPLQKDMEAHIKTARLSKEYSSHEATTKDLDLRKDTQLFGSQLLHRLDLIGIPFGKNKTIHQRKYGSFHEKWKLHWKPTFALTLVALSRHGSTVENVALRLLREKVKESDNLAEISELLAKTLNADLKGAIGLLLKKLEQTAALTDDVLLLADALVQLIQVIKYGNTRQTDAESVGQIVEQLVPRFCLALPMACQNRNAESSSVLFEKIIAINRALHLLGNAYFLNEWVVILRHIADDSTEQGIFQGIATRILLDKNLLTTAETAQRMAFALSNSQDLEKIAQWLEGFLNGSGLLLLHHTALWHILDEWVGRTDTEDLTNLLPFLRRTFSRFSQHEKQQMYALAQQPHQSDKDVLLEATEKNEVLESLKPLLQRFF